MTSVKLFRTVRIACLVFVVLGLAVSAAPAAEEQRYVTTTIRGQLTDPATGRPLADAIIRFEPLDPDSMPAEATTNLRGEFAVEGLTFGQYAIKIETADGERIWGINSLPVVPGEPVEIMLKISNKVDSTTSVENQPERFAAVVEKRKVRWKRFWKEFAAFWGAAAAVGLAAL
jgi:hypothetical protein